MITQSSTRGTIMAKAKIEIIEERCKGCDICVKLCPTKALALKNFKVYVEDIEKCTGCMACELRCPDFAISVTRI